MERGELVKMCGKNVEDMDAIKERVETLPSTFKQLFTVSSFEFLKFLRGKRLLAMLLLTTITVFLTVAISRPENSNDFISNLLAFITTFVVISVTLFGGDAVVSEFERKTGYLVFPLPLERSVLIFGKYLSALTASMIVVGYHYLLSIISVFLINGSLPSKVGLSFLYVFLYVLSALSIAFMISAFMKGTTGSSILTFALLFLIFPSIQSALSFAGVKPWFLVTFAAGISTLIFEHPYPKDTTEQFGNITLHIYYPEVAISIIVMIVYAILCLLLCWKKAITKEMA
ncbi:MAG: ABC transporter permease [Candidatus Wukongarchaeota archaeon]|nr:ABC transporter permease [Candidatus Wukongarchaeota archaeon]